MVTILRFKGVNMLIESFIDANLDKLPENIVIIGSTSLKLQGLIERDDNDLDILYFPSMEWLQNRIPDGRVDLVNYNLTLLAPDYMDRAVYFNEYNGKKIYGLSREDIIVNKISTYYKPKHKEDIALLWPNCNKDLVFEILEKAEARTDYADIRKQPFKTNSGLFKIDYMDDYVSYRNEKASGL